MAYTLIDLISYSEFSLFFSTFYVVSNKDLIDLLILTQSAFLLIRE